MPPNGSIFFLNLLPIIDSLSNRSPSTMETEERLGILKHRRRYGILRTFINDEHLCSHPPGARLLVLAHLCCKLFRTFYSKSYTRKRMDSYTADVTRSYT